MEVNQLRAGNGFDVHAFGDGDHVVLAGVRIPHDRGLVAHSDGDVALHALCDALLGAAGAGDLGRHFPDTDARYAGISSRRLLAQVGELLAGKQLAVINVDITVICQAPRLGPHIDAMCANLVEDLGVTRDRVNVKATTTERLGFCGREEGIAALATVLVGPG